ncbi:GTA head formation protein, RCAP_rcc01685 family [Oceanicella actignis]|uniref:Haemolysin XhlA n=1 Tax=Oceanicella actignis TaxID=1189325 RepID=A0A1M7TZF6_9RHOB|nr:hypothetical protein [Oceanicella actignis]TYO85054.1 hypothetical protein LY05_02768 [Oceanicella actignis]SET83352.1 hypothetical protein SAMN04488119_11120 [Oceanicella actignis]SHN76172.1 hypothetical protein SAMN05216200_11219 [Oceanicella actignis]
MHTSLRGRTPGSRYLYEPFDSAHARVEALERVLDERWAALERTLQHVESGLDRMERRMWLAVFSVAAALAGQFAAMLIGGLAR